MRKTINFIGLLPLLAFFLLQSTACRREVEPFAPLNYDFSPLDSGKYIIYQVDSILYDEYNESVDTLSYQVKYEYSRMEGDAADEPIYRLNYSHRSDSSQNWQLMQVFAAKNTDNQFQLVEDNQRLIKLVYPIEEGGAWNGLPFIRRDTSIEIRGGSINLYKDWDEFRYEQVYASQIIGGVVYDSTITVIQVDKTNNIERRYSRECYAKGIGLIEKEMWILDTQCGGDIASCIGTPWEEKAEKGFILRARILSHNF